MTNSTKTTNNTKATKKNGVSFTTLLTVIFIVLKLTGKISWSWAWVLSSIWIELAFIVLGIIIAVVIAVTKK